MKSEWVRTPESTLARVGVLGIVFAVVELAMAGIIFALVSSPSGDDALIADVAAGSLGALALVSLGVGIFALASRGRLPDGGGIANRAGQLMVLAVGVGALGAAVNLVFGLPSMIVVCLGATPVVVFLTMAIRKAAAQSSTTPV